MDILSIALLLVFFALFVLFILRADRGARVPLRPIGAYDSLKNVLAQGAESGQPVHISVGVAGVGAASTADTTAGLQTLEFLADRAAISAIPPVVTVGEPTALPLVQDQLHRAYRRQGYPEEYNPMRARFVAPPVRSSAMPYAAGVMDILLHENIFANVMVGSFGDEFLLMSETGAQRNLLQMGGTSAPNALPFVFTTVDQPLLGEEIYAAGAYLSNRPAHLGSLLAQDTLRGLLVVGIVLAALASTLGLIPATLGFR